MPRNAKMVGNSMYDAVGRSQKLCPQKILMLVSNSVYGSTPFQGRCSIDSVDSVEVVQAFQTDSADG